MNTSPRQRRCPVEHSIEVLEERALLSSAHAASESSRHEKSAIINQLPSVAPRTASTIPSNGDVNPYGVAFVPLSFPTGGILAPGDLLVSNFNNSNNLQGTGTTIDLFTPSTTSGGTPAVFFKSAQQPGLSTGLAVLKSGFVVVASFPSTDGTAANAGPGSILILDKSGNLVDTISGPLINGPWDLAVNDRGNHPQIFVSNAETGTVTRIDLHITGSATVTVTGQTQIASGYTHEPNATTFFIANTGLVYNPKNNTLYVASTGDNEIFAIRNASRTRRDFGTGRVAYSDPAHLHGPLGLTLAPNGDLITANGDAVNADPNQPSELVEFKPKGRDGKFVGQFSIDPNPDAPFGVTVANYGKTTVLAAVDDNQNTVSVWQVVR